MIASETGEEVTQEHQGVVVGYARVSTFEQNLDLQLDALEKAGCEKVFKDQLSGSSAAARLVVR